MPKPIMLQDACVLLNLVATDRFEDICAALDFQFVISTAVVSEALYLRDLSTGTREEIDLTDLINRKLLTIVSVDTDQERSRYVMYAAQLDDGEAMSLALAECRQIALATDDRKAIRLVKEQKLKVNIWSTVDLLQEWQRETLLPKDEMRKVLVAIRERARFIPRDAIWWNEVFAD
jgi:predicted nucleic acid-binding protein